MRRLILIAAVLFTIVITPQARAQTGILGYWQTSDHDIMEILPCGPSICARIVVIHPNAPAHSDINNPDPSLRTRPMCNLEIGTNFHPVDANRAEDGRLYDPHNGHSYSGLMYAEGNTLHLRGYLGAKIFGRTELWSRLPANTPIPPCN